MCASGCASNEALNKWTDDSEFISEKPRNNDRHDQSSLIEKFFLLLNFYLSQSF